MAFCREASTLYLKENGLIGAVTQKVTQQGYEEGLEGGDRQEAGTPVRRIHFWKGSKYKTINICFGNVSRFNKFCDNIPGRFL